MRDPDRIDLLMEKIEELWKIYPDWRLGQLIANCVRTATGRVNCDPFFIEDDKLLSVVQYLIDQSKNGQL